MNLSIIMRLALAIFIAGAIGSATAEEQPGRSEQRDAKGVLRLLPADSVTEHSIDTPSGRLAYTATAGTLAFFDQSGDQSASVFYT
ncbi:MAG: carboxypeptidase, partial [Pseudolabrys sp.]